MKKAKVVSISLSKEMDKLVQRLAEDERRTVSEIFREAVRQYVARHNLHTLREQAKTIVKEKGLKPEDVEEIIDEDRD